MGTVLFATVAFAATVAHADTRTVQLWTCTINVGKVPADVQAMNSKWVKFVNSKVKGGDVRSSMIRPVTGDLGQIMLLDSYPSMEAWAAQQSAMSTPEGGALEAEFDAVTKCTSANLYTSSES